MIKILLVDEQASIRRGVRMRLLLEPDFAVVGEASDGWEALGLVRELRPDVVVTGIRLPGMDGIALTERLRHDFPDCAVVILSLYDDPATQERAAKRVLPFSSANKTRTVNWLKPSVRQY